ncbi:hypothetical protein AUP74_00407 [Microbulbifer aggregans]|uniref:Tetratricopeptide repeat protein n=1 Tax=Microbulbifer aggregans TaxID=1769779 RepID=A0A1C9W401_9GAMM|nr:hypothetical protein [Microbulbifer aggregans]AOS95878.1 hypothetical protein AUP74_00407 [Microbulbifer aggregans]
MKKALLVRLIAVALTLAVAPQLWAADASQTVQELQHAWAQIKYRTPEKEQAEKFQQLSERARSATSEFSHSAPVWVWSGIIRASYAGAKGGLGALSAVKEAKADLEHAIAIDGSVLDGAAFTSLGSLYYQVPGWPIGFGDDKKAEEYLRKGLALGEDDIDANYFYADYLFQSKDYARALQYVQRAENAPRDMARPVASEGRLGEIKSLKAKIEGKLH